MISNGIPNGYCRVISPDGDLDFFGCFVNGSLVGNCWKGLMGGNFYNRVVPELEILTVLLDCTTKSIIVNEQPHCNGHFCWLGELASPAAEV